MQSLVFVFLLARMENPGYDNKNGFHDSTRELVSEKNILI